MYFRSFSLFFLQCFAILWNVAKRPLGDDDKRVLQDFGHRFETWLRRRGFTNTTYALKAKLDLTAVGRIINGQRGLSLVTAQRFLRGLGITLAEFYADEQLAGMDKRFPEEMLRFRYFLLNADQDALWQGMKSLERALEDMRERRGQQRGPPEAEKGIRGA